MDPWRVLAPGDHVEKLVERVLIERADDDRAEELVALSRLVGVKAGQVVALSLGAAPQMVQAATQAVLAAE